MKIIKTIFGNLGSRIWFIVTAVLVVVLLAASLVVTQVDYLRNTVSAVFGGERMILTGELGELTYESDYETKAEVFAAAREFNKSIAEEGIVMLKNDELSDGSKSMPLASGARISVFGKNSVDLVYGGSGSSANNPETPTSLYDALTDAGFVVNDTMKSFYESSASGSGRPAPPAMGQILAGFPTGETDVDDYTDAVTSSYSQYNDAALVVISRMGGEGFDLPRTMKQASNGSYVSESAWTSTTPVDGARSIDDHYLQLDQYETDMINEACEHFDNVIIVLNSSAPLELGFLDDPAHYAYNENIRGALWLGNPGGTGIYALGEILNGTVNPSGRLVDTYSRDFRNDPTWNNFGNNMEYLGNMYMLNGQLSARASYYQVQYEEGIYVGYRYYETRGYTEMQAGNADWYGDNVVYPFGYGLSYTTFDWQLGDLSAASGSTIGADDEITVEVTVTNTGDKAGKEVVQLYYSAPYTAGQTEKAHVVLGAFAKTDMLYPASEAGEGKPNSQTVTLTFKVRDMASYDYSDADKDTNTGYEVDGGTYHIYVGRNAHDAWAGDGFDITYTVPGEGYNYKTDSATENEIVNLFDDVSGKITQYLSRNNWSGTWPTMLTEADRNVDQAFIDSLTYTTNDAGQPWEETEMPTTGASGDVKFYQLVGVDYDDPLWDSLLDQLTVDEMATMIGQGNYNTGAIMSIDKPKTTDPDGPAGFTLFMGDPTVYDTCWYACECLIAATWNVDIARGMGEMIGNEGLVGNQAGDGRPYSGWYAPAVNIHRSQFSGRNWEYYSEDGFLSGKMAANVIQGAKSKGVYCYVKHFALNDQETSRDAGGVLTWANEQTMREIYFKPFEMSVKEGGTTAIMSSFNRIGTVWAGGDYRLLTQLLRDEWGFRGMVVTDYNLMLSGGYMLPDQMIRAGGDINLSQDGKPSTDAASLTATQVASLRRATKNVLYTVANSNAMNGLGEGSSFYYALPYWTIVLIIVDCVIALGLAVWGFFAIRGAIKKAKAKQNT